MKKSNWEKIGSVGIDSGTCYVGDPCSFIKDSRVIMGRCVQDKTALEESGIRNWMDFCGMMAKEEYPNTKQLDYTKGNPGLGVVFSTGFGDGQYDVYAKFVNDPVWGERVKEVKVVFIGDEDE